MGINNNLTTYTFIDGDLSMDVYISLEQRNVYMKQTEIAKLLEIDKGTVSRFINIIKESQMGQVAENVKICNKNGKSVANYYCLKIIKEIGEKYNQERIKKLEDWLEQIFVENTQEVVDDEFRIIRYHQDNLDIPVRYDKESGEPLMTQKELSILYGTTKQSIGQHIKNIFEDKELDKNSVVKNYFTTGIDGKTYEVMLYNYDMILAIGYRTRTAKAINFRNWATSIIKQYQRINYELSLSSGNLSPFESLVTKKLEKHDEEIDTIKKTLDRINPITLAYQRNDSYLAYIFLSILISTVEKEVFIIDQYADRFIISVLGLIRDNVKIYIVTNNPNRISKGEQEIFYRMHPNNEIILLEIKYEHDRFIFVDREYGYNLGQSVNTIGYCKVNLMRIDDIEFINNKINEYCIE